VGKSARSFEELLVWQKAHLLVMSIYSHTKSFPKEEVYGLTSQFRRAAISVPANIAEGFKKESKADKLRFLNIAQGSLEECRYYFRLAFDLGYLSTEALTVQEMIEQVSKLLYGYMKGIRNKQADS
jgi:four helix bundle protein